MGVYFLVNKDVHPSDRNVSYDMSDQQDLARSLFENSSEREQMFLDNGVLSYHIYCLPSCTLPLAKRLNSLRASLVKTYFNAEKEISSIKFEAPFYIYRLFYECFWDISTDAKASNLQVRDFV